MGYIHSQYLSGDRVRMAMGVHRDVNGSDVYRALTTSIDANGNGSMEFDGSVTFDGGLDLTADNKHIAMYDSRFDASYGGVPTTGAQVERCIGTRDKNNLWVGRLTLRQEANGTKRSMLEVVGTNSGGTTVWNSLSPYVTADGTRGYTVSDPAAFCSALHVGDYVTNSASSVSTTTSNYHDVLNFTLPAGIWMVFANLEFAANGTGRRVACLNTTAGGSGISLQWRSTGAAISGAVSRIRVTGVLLPTKSTKYYLTSWQNSGGNLAVTAVVQAVRIK